MRIQTHGMRLASTEYCRTLVDAGIDEYFISVTADSAELHDRITEIPGSFDKTVQAIRNLDAFPSVKIFTNTVITRLSFPSLPGVVELFRDIRRLERMDFWNYWPMAEEDDTGLLASHFDILPWLQQAVRAARQLGRQVEIKNFPHCLLGDCASCLINDQPELRIDPRFWNEFNRNGFHQCEYRDVCGSKQCLGLNAAYAKKFGWHADRLQPMPREV